MPLSTKPSRRPPRRLTQYLWCGEIRARSVDPDFRATVIAWGVRGAGDAVVPRAVRR